MNVEKIPIVTAADEHYAPFLGVMLTTLLENTSKRLPIHFYVIDDDISPISKRKLYSIVSKLSERATIQFIKTDKSLYKNCLISDHITITAYLRISLPDIVKNCEAKKVLYIDADTFVISDIRQLYQIDLEEKVIGAVIDPGQTKALKERLRVDSEDYYFNSGILVVNLEEWEKANVTEKTLNFLTNHSDKILYHDQDALNAVLHDQWKSVHPQWNMQSSLIFKKYQAPDEQYRSLYQEAIKFPSIIHFTGHDKPWNTLRNHPYQNVYMNKLKRSLFMKKMEEKKDERFVHCFFS